jgi:hypothetical protein
MDKMDSKLLIGQGKYVTTIGRAALINSIVASQDIYPLIVLSPLKVILKAIFKLERAFLGGFRQGLWW